VTDRPPGAADTTGGAAIGIISPSNRVKETKILDLFMSPSFWKMGKVQENYLGAALP
jgi:hypothetical protein